MKKSLLICLILLIFILCACKAADMQPSESMDPQLKENASLFGVVDGNTYTNDAIGISAVLPEEWEVASQEQLSTLSGLAIDRIKEKTGMEPETQMLILFCSKYGYGYNGFNPCITVQVSNQANMSLLLFDEEALNFYLEHSRSQFEQTYGASGVEVSGKIGVKIGDNEYSVINLKADFEGISTIQHMYILSVEDYVLLIGETYSNESEKPEIHTFVESLKIQ